MRTILSSRRCCILFCLLHSWHLFAMLSYMTWECEAIRLADQDVFLVLSELLALRSHTVTLVVLYLANRPGPG
ncbi:hypothetical protein QBC46DRAFT_382076 [Diplogelasinospora grovesii]|uniref:Secreted protein n=1 Tax=Diplogelasinospora grovesii TaxID=303347 RepID=A0AAN6NCA8_9PEZI|nr:hypothetical protein QBC46DRAFT_382076 [Diplogelasinospora grovesii]